MSEMIGLVPPWLQVALLVVLAFFMGRWSARRDGRDRPAAPPQKGAVAAGGGYQPGDGRGAGIDPGRWPQSGLDTGLDTQVLSLLHGGRKIEAIRLVRERTGQGLKEAKDAVEALERQHKPSGT